VRQKSLWRRGINFATGRDVKTPLERGAIYTEHGKVAKTLLQQRQKAARRKQKFSYQLYWAAARRVGNRFLRRECPFFFASAAKNHLINLIYFTCYFSSSPVDEWLSELLMAAIWYQCVYHYGETWFISEWMNNLGNVFWVICFIIVFFSFNIELTGVQFYSKTYDLIIQGNVDWNNSDHNEFVLA
jgi:hypothetical protein